MPTTKLPVRKHIRFSGFNYSLEGRYFITIVVQDRVHLFGDVHNEEMVLNDAGNMVAKTLSELSNHFEDVKILEYVVMPNHVHFIVYLPGNIQLKTVVSEFKSYTTHLYSDMVNKDAQPFKRRLWQRNYYEHIIRNPRAYDFISHYIKVNPQRWKKDALNLRHETDTDEIMKTVLDLQ